MTTTEKFLFILRSDQKQQLRDLAAREGRSMGDIIRRAISEYIDRAASES